MYGNDYEMWIATVGDIHIKKMGSVCLGLSVVVVIIIIINFVSACNNFVI